MGLSMCRHCRGDGVPRRGVGFRDPNGEGQHYTARAHPLVYFHGGQESKPEAAAAAAAW